MIFKEKRLEKEGIKELLWNTQYKDFLFSIENISVKGFIYKDLYKIGLKNTECYAVKIRSAKNEQIANTIKYLSKIDDQDELFNKYENIYIKNGFYILISKWIEGYYLENEFKKYLPCFFGKLAKLNQKNLCSGPYSSMYADGKYSYSISELIESEIEYHLKYWELDTEKGSIHKILENLKRGLPCIIYEDINIGNILITKEAKIKIIDVEWLQPGLNLYQFDHIDYFGFNGNKLYNIIEDDAKNCFSAYFDELRISKEEANEQIRAYEILALLRQNTYWKYYKKSEMYDQAKIRLDKIINLPVYI